MPRSNARCSVAIDSLSSAGPYAPDMLIQPSPKRDTLKSVAPNFTYSIAPPYRGKSYHRIPVTPIRSLADTCPSTSQNSLTLRYSRDEPIDVSDHIIVKTPAQNNRPSHYPCRKVHPGLSSWLF